MWEHKSQKTCFGNHVKLSLEISDSGFIIEISTISYFLSNWRMLMEFKCSQKTLYKKIYLLPMAMFLML